MCLLTIAMCGTTDLPQFDTKVTEYAAGQFTSTVMSAPPAYTTFSIDHSFFETVMYVNSSFSTVEKLASAAFVDAVIIYSYVEHTFLREMTASFSFWSTLTFM